MGGNEKVRALWRHYYQNTEYIFYVVDCNDKERLQESKELLYNSLKEGELNKSVLIVVANKQDLPNSVKKKELIEKFELEQIKDRKWYVFECGRDLYLNFFEEVGAYIILHERGGWSVKDHHLMSYQFKLQTYTLVCCLKRIQQTMGLKVPKFLVYEIIKNLKL